MLKIGMQMIYFQTKHELNDISKGPIYKITCFKSIRAKTILMPCNQDLYFRTEDNLIEHQYISRSKFRPIDSSFGHCAANPGNDKNFQDKLDKNIKDLLN